MNNPIPISLHYEVIKHFWIYNCMRCIRSVAFFICIMNRVPYERSTELLIFGVFDKWTSRWLYIPGVNDCCVRYQISSLFETQYGDCIISCFLCIVEWWWRLYYAKESDHTKRTYSVAEDEEKVTMVSI